jgi:hypothetical protein
LEANGEVGDFRLNNFEGGICAFRFVVSLWTKSFETTGMTFSKAWNLTTPHSLNPMVLFAVP